QTDLKKLVDSYFKSALLPKSCQLSVKHCAPPTVVEMDPDQMVQVLTNLVTNAAEAMPCGGKITVETFVEPGRAGFRVADTGCGIKEENRKKIFEPFFTTKQIGKGTGLGLAVSYGIVKVHRGNITVETNADPAKGPTGTVFSVSLPQQSPKNAAAG
ncbi:MAG TPA: ATP-binding protein, partial [Elusimicrobiales bacterium]|nr:ATP-binding protein [Elusimicrobiales bacterium]